MRDLVLKAPPNVRMDSFGDAARELGKLAAIGKRLWQEDSLKSALRLFRQSAGEALDRWFESPIRSRLCWVSTRSSATWLVRTRRARPTCCCTHFRRSERQAGRMGPRDRRHGRHHPGDGEGRRRARRRHCCGRAVREVIIERGRAAGIVLEDGTPIRARSVIANVNPKRLFQTLVPREAVPTRWRSA